MLYVNAPLTPRPHASDKTYLSILSIGPNLEGKLSSDNRPYCCSRMVSLNQPEIPSSPPSRVPKPACHLFIIPAQSSNPAQDPSHEPIPWSHDPSPWLINKHAVSLNHAPHQGDKHPASSPLWIHHLWSLKPASNKRDIPPSLDPPSQTKFLDIYWPAA